MVLTRRARATPLPMARAAPPPPSPPTKKSKKKATPVPGVMREPGATTVGRATVVVDEAIRVDEEIEPESENNRLREQLLRVLVDHQRQEEEIVALRALARSLKEEVELIQKQNARATSNAQTSKVRTDASYYGGNEKRPHEFFKLDLQVERLHAENARLRDELCDTNGELEILRAFVNSELPQFKIAAVQARAELECVKSQLHDERAHCDRLEAQIAHYKARSNVPVPTPTAQPLQGNNRRSTTNKPTKFEEYPNNLSQNKCHAHAMRESSRRERESFLLQCRLSAVRSEEDDDKENSDCCGGNLRDSADEKAASPPDAKSRLSMSPVSIASSSSSSSRAPLSSSKLLLSSRVHRDLSVLDHELHALHQALREIPQAAPNLSPKNGAKTK